MKYHITTLGCSKNTADSEALATKLANLGWNWTQDASMADIVVINTCGFINDAKEESLRVIIEGVELKENCNHQVLVVFGCLVKRYKKELMAQIPEVDLFFEFLDDEAFKQLASFNAKTAKQGCPSLMAGGCQDKSRYFTPKHIGFLKIAEGCNNRCSYCAIPGIRGNFCSYDKDRILKDAVHLAESGAKELSIIAQDITKYGTDNAAYGSLAELVKELSKINEIQWIRLHYMHPAGLTPSIIDQLYGIDKVAPYFDIPMQHISQKMLNLMNRHTTKQHMINLIKHIRATFADAAIRTTFIVGFPGETKRDFEQLIDFIEAYPLDKVGAFMYSREEDTAAYDMRPRVQLGTKTARLDQLMTLQQLLVEEANQRYLGRELEVMVDRLTDGGFTGRTKYDAWEVDNTTTVTGLTRAVTPGEVVRVRVTDASAYDFSGVLL
jgi:ribosomal protein S12 methylthiotransferase